MMGWKQTAVHAVLAAVSLVLHEAHADSIVVGQVAPLSGLESNQGRAYGVGMQLAFGVANKAAGGHGHTFKLVRKDDGGRPDLTVSATRALLAEDRPMVLAGYYGSKNIAALVESGVLEKERVPLVGYRITEVRGETPYLYSVRASLSDELNKIVGHLAIVGISRLGLFYEDAAGAPAVIKAVEDVAAKAQVSVVAKASYPASTARVQSAVDAFLKVQPQAILMVSTGAAGAALIEKYRADGGGAQLFAHSGADVEQMAKRLSEEQLQGVAIAQVTPNPYKMSTRVTKEFNDLIAKTPNLEVPVSYSMIEGFIAGKVIVEAVRRQGAKPTREGALEALDAMDNYDLGGYLISFRPNMRNGSRFVELSIVSSSGRIRQ